MAIAVGQFTIYDFHDVYSATTPPTNPQKNQVWLDTSATPPVMKTWNGTEWLVANDYVSGGTNLLYNTGKMKDTSYWYINKATGTAGLELVDDSEVGKAIKFTIGEDVTSWCYFGNNSYRGRKFEIGQDYTISFLAKADDVRKINLTFQNGNATAKAIHFGDVTLNTGWKRYEVTAKAMATGDEPLLYIVAGGTGNKTIHITKLKLETGNRASDWSQAPEDIEKELIRVESKVEVNADAILQKVSKTDYTGNTIVSMINQTAESVKISAKNIELNGAVTFSSFDSSTQSKITNIENTANNASSAANTANTNATTAVNTANNASSAASTAQNTANNAQSSANTANNKLDSWSYPTDKTTINGGKIMTGSVTAKQIAAQTITADKLRVGDFNNLVQIHPDLNPNGNAVFTSDGVNYFKIGQGGYAAIVLFRSFNLDFVQNDEYSFIYTGYKDSNITGVSLIARYFYTDSTWNNAGHADLSMGNSVSTKTVTLKITAKPTAGKTLREIRFFMEKDNTTTGYYYLTDMQLYKKGKGSLIVDGSIEAKHLKAGAITADIITSGTFKGTNFVAGGSTNGNGYISVLNASNDALFRADKEGLYAKNIIFATSPDYNPKMDGYYWADGYGFHGESGYDDGTLNSWSQGIHASIEGIRLEKHGEYQVNTGVATVEPHQIKVCNTQDTLRTVIMDNLVSTTGELNAGTHIRANGEIIAQGAITSKSGVYGASFLQTNYGLPIEIGKYIDMHQAGSTTDVDVRIEASGRRAIMFKCGNDLSQGTEIGRINNNASFIKNLNGGQFLTMEDSGRLTYDGFTVPHNWRQSFTPFVYSDTGNFSSSGVVGQATYLGDLVFVQGRIIASRGGHSGSVCIGGLPVSNAYNYPAVNFGFFGGVTGNLGNAGYDIRGYIQSGASHIILNFSNKDNGGWTALNCSHLTTGNVDISFSAVYRWR